MTNFVRVSTLLIAVIAALGGCTTSPEHRVLAWEEDLPRAWAAGGAPDGNAPEAWLSDFEAPALPGLVAEALANNPDLQVTAARFEQSLSENRIVAADRQPEAGLGLDGSRQKLNNFGPFSSDEMSLGERVSELIPEEAPEELDAAPELLDSLNLFPDTASSFDNYQLRLNLRWEVDLWGRLRDLSSAALARAEARQAELRGARLSLAAQVAKGWFNLAEAKQQVEQARKNLRSYTDNLETLEDRFRSGLSEGLALRMTRSQAAAAAAELSLRQRALDQAARQLEVILGRYPSAELEASHALPPLPRAIPVGLPSDLLTRRPDLVAAERRLAAAEQEASAAKKDRFPRFELTASGGTASREFRNLLDDNFSVWGLGANLTQPVFQAGRIRANIDRSISISNQAKAAYRSQVLQAFLEVESTLAAEKHLHSEYAQLSLAAEEAEAAEALAWERYRDGISPFINVLDTRRTAATTESRRIRLRNQLLQNRLNLYLALGGDFAESLPDQTRTVSTASAPH